MIIVRESINFERGLDPKQAMNIGIKSQIIDWIEGYLKLIGNDKLQDWQKCYYKINDDLTINFKGGQEFNLKWYWAKNLPEFIQFNKFVGYLKMENINLTSLRGCPKSIDGSFSCIKNNLKNLIGGPEIVTENYFCGQNPFESLEGLAKEIHGKFTCNNKMGLTEKNLPKYTEITGEIKIGYWGIGKNLKKHKKFTT
jgi:hypothetical protein